MFLEKGKCFIFGDISKQKEASVHQNFKKQDRALLRSLIISEFGIH